MHYNFSLIVPFLLLATTLSSQFINIESERMQTGTVRFVFKNDLNASYYNADGEYIYDINEGVAMMLKSPDFRKKYFLIANYGLIRAKNQDYSNSWLLHFRFNYELSKSNDIYRLEAFVQSSGNQLLDVTNRNLVGAGIRLKLPWISFAKVYFGNSYVYEQEKSDVLDERFVNHRNSSYLSFSAVLPRNEVTVVNTIYYQPLYSDFSDFTIFEELKMEYPLSDVISLSATFKYFYDSLTPLGRKQYSSTISLGLVLNIQSREASPSYSPMLR